MKAAVLFKNGDIRYTDFEEPAVRPGTVKVHVRATGICGSDVPRVLHNGAHFIPLCWDTSLPATWWKWAKGWRA